MTAHAIICDVVYRVAIPSILWSRKGESCKRVGIRVRGSAKEARKRVGEGWERVLRP